MADPKLVRYVLVARARGFSEEQIRQRLVSTGWKEYDIDEAFYQSANPHALSAANAPAKISAVQAKISKEKNFFGDIPPMFLGSLVILAVILVASAAFTFSLLGGETPEGTVATGALTSAPSDNEAPQNEILPDENTSTENPVSPS